MQDALVVDEFMAGTADMIDDFVAPPLNQGRANPRRQVVEHFVPGDSLPFALAAFTSAHEWIENALGIVDLVKGRRTFGAVPSAAARMRGIALEFADAAGFFIDVREQSAGGFAIETDRRD